MRAADTVTSDFLASFGAAWNAHDVEAVLAHMTSDCVFLVKNAFRKQRP